MSLDTLLDEIKQLKRKDLLQLHRSIIDMLDPKETLVQYAYTEILTELSKRYRDIKLKHWRLLSTTQKGQFAEAWYKSEIDLTRLGFTDQLSIQQLLVRLICRFKYDHIDFKNLIVAMASASVTLQEQFPGYSDTSLKIVEQSIRRIYEKDKQQRVC